MSEKSVEMTEKGKISRLLENYEGHNEDMLRRTVMDLVVRANWKKLRRFGHRYVMRWWN